MRIELGRARDGQLKFESALNCFSIALVRDPDNVDAHIARSATLRSLRRYAEAEHEIARLCKLRQEERGLKLELGWIHHDKRRLVEAANIFRNLLSTAASNVERAEAHHGLGWVAFAESNFAAAEQEFQMAVENRPHNLEYELALAWALARQGGERRRQEAELIAWNILARRLDPSAHVCLGVLAFQSGMLASSEYHLKEALRIDPWHGSHADLGALYVHMARYDDGESELRIAASQDWYDTAAHTELGSL